jgi:putative sterol carrier protein
VPTFTSADEVYEVIGGLFAALSADPEQALQLARADLTVQYRLSEPDARITVQMRQGRGDRVDLGETEQVPDVVMIMPAGVLHGLLLGTVNATVAMARGQIRSEGPVAKVLALIPMLRLVAPRYRERLAEIGRADLLESG